MSNRKMKVTKPLKAARGGTRKSGQHLLIKEKQLELSLIRTYPRQVVFETYLPILPRVLATTVTTGVIANSYEVSSAAIQSFSARFASTFLEYRMTRAQFQIRLFSATNPGVIQFWFDEKNVAAPVLAGAQERYILSVNASGIDQQHTLKWVNGDPQDLQYNALSTVVTPVTFKSYTDAANFGSSAVATNYCVIEGRIFFQFRGLQAV